VSHPAPPGRLLLVDVSAARPVICLSLLVLAGCRSSSSSSPPPVARVARAQTAVPKVVMPQGSVWRFWDERTDPDPSWRQPTFDDFGWREGPAQLGYGQGDEATQLSFGTDPAQKPITIYFRRQLEVARADRLRSLVVRVLHDEGAVVHLNGVEIYRENLPAGALTGATRALQRAVRPAFVERQIDPALLRSGENLLTAEVHLSAPDAAQVSFDLALTGSMYPAVSRGPYLQMGGPTRVTIRWRSDPATAGQVRWGPAPSDLAMTADDPAVAVEHAVTLTGLQPATRYHYAVGTPTDTLAGGDGEHSFVTPPAPGTRARTRIWAIGDSGTGDDNAARVRDAYLKLTGDRHTDLWLMLGDNAYGVGTDEQYQRAVFDFYPQVLRRVFLWPALGNADTYSMVGNDMAYLDLFTLPARAEMGGVASGSELYYSFDHGDVHLVALDSMLSDRTPGGAMLTWLNQDLAATRATWVIAYWHHPPYTKGHHDSDTEIELVDMRESAVPILEAHGVDLVLTGHSHSYERSYLLDGHHGDSTTLTAAMKRDHGGGRPDDGGAYVKRGGARATGQGAVYVVAGSSGQTTFGVLDHPAMVVGRVELGSVVVEVEGDTLEAIFLRDSGAIEDRFTIRKGVPPPTTPPAAPAELAVEHTLAGVKLLWKDRASDESDFVVERADEGGGGVSFGELARTGANATAMEDTTVAVSTRYRYRVRAANAAGVSPPSNEAAIATPRCLPACLDAGAGAAPGPGAGGAGGIPDAAAPKPRRPSGGCQVSPRRPPTGGFWPGIAILALLPALRRKGTYL
jgi:hypothetical protein